MIHRGNEMRITFVNVGYGEAIWVECPQSGQDNAFTILIDGGSNLDAEYADCSTGRVRLLDYLKQSGVDHIDVMILSHIHEDHVCGLLPVARKFPPKTLWQGLPTDLHRHLPPMPSLRPAHPDRAKFADSLRDWQNLLLLVEKQGCNIRTLKSGDFLMPCAGMEIQSLAPTTQRVEELSKRIEDVFHTLDTELFFQKLSALDAAMNNFSLVLRLDWKGKRVLLPGDTNLAGYRDIPLEDLWAHIFKVGHHGQKDAADEALLRAVHPDVMVCCASSDRRYGSAWLELMELAERLGIRVLYSDCPPLPAPLTTPPPHRALQLELLPGQPMRIEYLGLEGDVLNGAL